VALPLAADGTQADADAPVAHVLVACIGPAKVERTLAIWNPAQSHVYLVDRRYEPMAERTGAPPPVHGSGALVEALLRAPGATAEAARGRYSADVLGAVAPLSGLPGYVVVEQAQARAYVHVFGMLLTMALIILLVCGGALAVGFYVSRRVVSPLDRLIDAARRVGTGDLSVRVPVEQENELGELARTFNAMTGELADSMQRLQANEERLRIALDAAQMGTWNWTANPERILWSPQTYALLDVPRSRRDDLFSAFLSRVHPDDQTKVLERIRAVMDGQTRFAIEHRIRSREGEERWVRLQGRVYRTDGRPRRMSGVIMDITTRKQAELELKAAKEEAEEMSRLKSAFLANVSHEIRTPLTSIIGFADVLVEEVPEAHRDGAEKIVQSGHRLMQTLDSVLDLSMIEAGEFSLSCRAFDLAAEVRQRAELMRPTAERKGLNLDIEAPESEVKVHLDPNCLDRILTNLLTNAIKFTEEGGVQVRVRTQPSSVVVQVVDTGIGIGDDFQSELFEAFKQESGGLQREHQGTGLGLSITKELVDLMEGDIDVESQKGAGTTVTVRFPYRVSETREPVLRAGTAENL
jgi:signal transduction histidine kinase